MTVSLDRDQIYFGDEFGYFPAYPEPRDSWGPGRRCRDGCSLQFEKTLRDPIFGVGVTSPRLTDIRNGGDM